MKRILIYSHDTYGLGNIRRTLTIAEHLVATHDDVSVLIATGSPMLHAFRLCDRLDYIKLPCLTRGADGGYGVKSLGLSYESTLRMRSRMLAAAAIDFDPDVIIVDKKPFGVDDELRDALRLAADGPRSPRTVLLLRDILDAPEVTAAIWRRNGYFEAIERRYDSVLVLGTKDVFDLPVEYEFPAGCADKVEFCGYLRRAPGRVGAAEQRSRLGISTTQPLVFVTTGGGEDGAAVATAALDALELPGLDRAAAVVLTGPEMAAADTAVIRDRAEKRPATTVLEFSDDVMSLMEAADVVVSMAGYNTVCEILSARRPAVVVPRVLPVTEQLIRAEKLARTGRLTMVHPDEADPAALRDAILRELDASRQGKADDAVDLVDLGGLDRVEKQIAVLLDDA